MHIKIHQNHKNYSPLIAENMRIGTHTNHVIMHIRTHTNHNTYYSPFLAINYDKLPCIRSRNERTEVVEHE
jgi:hypothetical protein